MDLEKLKMHIKHNCNISDAKYWGHYSVCGMLLGLRELYRQEHGLSPWQKISEAEILPWIAEREALWSDIEELEFGNIEINGVEYGPFDVERINYHLKPCGYIYGAGYGLHLKPTFFLASLNHEKQLYSCTVSFSDNEFCQDLYSAPAMVQGNQVYIRLLQFTKLLYETYMKIHGNKYKDSRVRAFSYYGINNKIEDKLLDKDPLDDFGSHLYDKFKLIANEVSIILALHEVGESIEDGGSDIWLQVIGGCSNRYTNIYLRGFKDLLADTSKDGPLKFIIENKKEELFNFYIVLLGSTVKELFPEILTAFDDYCVHGQWEIIEKARKDGYMRAITFRKNIISLWQSKKDPQIIKSYIESYLKNVGC